MGSWVRSLMLGTGLLGAGGQGSCPRSELPGRPRPGSTGGESSQSSLLPSPRGAPASPGVRTVSVGRGKKGPPVCAPRLRVLRVRSRVRLEWTARVGTRLSLQSGD